VRWQRGEAGLAAALARHGVVLEAIELLLLTHHHADHAGLAARVSERAGCLVAGSAETAARVADVDALIRREDAYAEALLRLHGAGEEVVATVARASAWSRDGAESVAVDRILGDGECVRAGDGELTVALRPGHSTSDTVFVSDDGWALVGDHLLASSGSTVLAHRPLADADPARRPRAMPAYRDGLRATAAAGLARAHPGHGPAIADPGALARDRLGEQDRRAQRALEALRRSRPADAWTLARELWPAFARPDGPGDDAGRVRHPVARPWIALSDVLGLLDMLVEDGRARERADDGRILFENV